MLRKTPRTTVVARVLAVTTVAASVAFVATQSDGDNASIDQSYNAAVAAAREGAAADGARSAPREPVPAALSQALTDQASAAADERVAIRAAEAAAAKKAAEEAAAEAAAKKAAEEAAAKKAEEEAAAKEAAEMEAARKAEADAADRAEREAKAWVLPLAEFRITAGFGSSGNMWSSTHTGLDFAAPAGTDVRAIGTGTVSFAEWDGPYGNKIEIQHPDGTVSWYAHLSNFVLHAGSEVAPGDVIGNVGSTGNSTGPHMHLEIHPDNGSAVDPRAWLADQGLGL